MRCVITGATGLLGTALCQRLKARGDGVVVLSRDPSRVKLAVDKVVAWDPEKEPVPPAALQGADAVIHLAGESVAGHRWNTEQKRRILDSRVVGGNALAAAIGAMEKRPGVLVSASAVGFYGDRGEEMLDEDSSPGSDFLAHVCQAWERSVAQVEPLGVRRVSVRLGVVLSARGGALGKMLPVFKAGLGGRLGDGKQYFPWIHLDDAVGLLLLALDDPRASGAVNAVAPEPATNAQFTHDLATALHRPAVMAVPRLALSLGMGEMSAALLGSQRVTPRRALDLGYHFAHPALLPALKDLLAAR